ncbi:MAG: hypothetical protein ABI416_13475 [Ginsengibacter sp.]
MSKRYVLIFSFLAGVTLYSCSKKNHPSRTPQPPENNTSLSIKKDDSLAEKKVIVKRKEKIPIPKVITVNDSAARKSVDGRYYYDVMGHRYWRNYKDGKYYLFNKSMYTDDAFKPL